ncbi:MAG: helix-turn-helix domain-containing protein [Acidobacteriia bacterium]|nr:helix-turn-helix domain-containing protein [Terriglobia bacterium]
MPNRSEAEPQEPQARPERVAYRPKDVIAATGIVRTMIYGAIRRGELRALRLGPRALVIPAENLKAWLASLPPAVGE